MLERDSAGSEVILSGILREWVCIACFGRTPRKKIQKLRVWLTRSSGFLSSFKG